MYAKKVNENKTTRAWWKMKIEKGKWKD